MKDYWKTIERLLKDYWKTIERLLKDCWKTIERLLKDYWKTIGRLLKDYWKTIEKLLEDYWKTIGSCFRYCSSSFGDSVHDHEDPHTLHDRRCHDCRGRKWKADHLCSWSSSGSWLCVAENKCRIRKRLRIFDFLGSPFEKKKYFLLHRPEFIYSMVFQLNWAKILCSILFILELQSDISWFSFNNSTLQYGNFCTLIQAEPMFILLFNWCTDWFCSG